MASASSSARSEDDIYRHTVLRPSIEVSSLDRQIVQDRTAHSHHGYPMSLDLPEKRTAELENSCVEQHSEDNCDKNHDPLDATITIMSTSKQAGMTVAPFLAKHIPEQYAPMGLPVMKSQTQKDPNTKYCYRHRPDSKCRRTADEPTMENLQRVCDSGFRWLHSTDRILGTGSVVTVGSTRHLPRLVSLLCCASET